jgi:hypothetical protein
MTVVPTLLRHHSAQEASLDAFGPSIERIAVDIRYNGRPLLSVRHPAWRHDAAWSERDWRDTVRSLVWGLLPLDHFGRVTIVWDPGRAGEGHEQHRVGATIGSKARGLSLRHGGVRILPARVATAYEDCRRIVAGEAAGVYRRFARWLGHRTFPLARPEAYEPDWAPDAASVAGGELVRWYVLPAWYLPNGQR